jgi:hypothetical protein
MAIRLLFAYAFGRPESEQNSSLQLLQGAAVEVLRFSSLVTGLNQFLCTRRCHVIGGDKALPREPAKTAARRLHPPVERGHCP